ncbi:hypothetical protein UFOVP434_12 [uncultured Caudovirales phage]|uniref:Uncharacterized protein n=1 Tax=uncultured Caudovirales phage TaxID=2100421 RepID=A0A6J5MBF3_9CAUD|nr:hypothetical protein UFOVP434_12 [uncultured Caudovirales phage]
MQKDNKKFFKYYAKIIQYCVDNSTNHFSGKWFRETFPDSEYNDLNGMQREHLISLNRGTMLYFVSFLYSHLYWIGKICASAMYNSDINMSIKADISLCARDTKLDNKLIEFLSVMVDRTTEQKAAILEIFPKEVRYLEDYFYTRLGSAAVKRRINLPFSEDFLRPEDLDLYVNYIESVDCQDISD